MGEVCEARDTIDDPKACTAPWIDHMKFNLYPDTELLQHTCENENRRPRMPAKGEPK
jgi:hypothetical protein